MSAMTRTSGVIQKVYALTCSETSAPESIRSVNSLRSYDLQRVLRYRVSGITVCPYSYAAEMEILKGSRTRLLSYLALRAIMLE
jgi:hypothetical protein